MHKLLQGIHRFRSDVFRSQRELFERLADGQCPDALFITCSDSRINPNLITQTDPGELFILRNAGNIVPPYGAANGGEGATIEFAVVGLGVRDIIICGHSDCGAMKALHRSESLREMPLMAAWLAHAEATRQIACQRDEGLAGHALLNVAIQENVLVQLENLRTHPAVAAGQTAGTLKLHGWVYKIERGEVFAFYPDRGEFLPLTEAAPAPVPRSARLTAARAI
jgi:carbonic anhydrase